jgi:RimJ/RimL family protein N-acetyltransferase
MTTRAEPMRVERVTLEGTRVRLEPLSLDHLDALCEIALDPDLWRWTVAQVHDRDALRRYIENALREESAGTALPFATVERRSGRVVGSTRYGAIDVRSRRVEIGWTFVGRPWQRSAVNTEAKYLMLRHAFEQLGCNRVELKTDALNARSRAAILRIGAVEEGTLRRHTVTETGRVRDTVYFGITDEEWPAVRERLERRLAR